MSDIQKFMSAAAADSDPCELADMMRAAMLDQPGGAQLHWLREIHLALDGYGGARHAGAAARVADGLRLLEGEIAAATPPVQLRLA